LIIPIIKHELSIDDLYRLFHNIFRCQMSKFIRQLDWIQFSFGLHLCDEIKFCFGLQLNNVSYLKEDIQFGYGLKFYNYVNLFEKIKFLNLNQKLQEFILYILNVEPVIILPSNRTFKCSHQLNLTVSFHFQ
jgi:hypothetical protein